VPGASWPQIGDDFPRSYLFWKSNPFSVGAF